MDRVELTIEDVNRLIEWRDAHPTEVRSHPAPLKAVEIRIKENGWRIKGIREGNSLRLHLSKENQQFGNCTFIRRTDGMWASTKNRMRVSEDDLRSVLTVYCSLMALMVYGQVETKAGQIPDKVQGNTRKKPINGRNQKKPPRTTYILKSGNGALMAVPRDSHASPGGIFSVRGHFRHYKNGKVIWISEYRKGEGKKKKKTYKMGGKSDDRSAD